MPGDLDIHIKMEEPVAIEENQRHQNAMRLQEGEGVPENIGVGGLQFILQKGADGIIDRIPETQQQIRSLPNLWYVVKNFQALKFDVKLSNENQKALGGDAAPINVEIWR